MEGQASLEWINKTVDFLNKISTFFLKSFLAKDPRLYFCVRGRTA